MSDQITTAGVTSVESRPGAGSKTMSRSNGSLIPLLALLSMLSLGSYILGLLHWSILWSVILLTSAYFVIQRRINRLREYHRHHVEREAAREKLENHVESAEWLNFILDRFWTVLEPVICVNVCEKVNFVLDSTCPGFLDSLELSEFTLGSSAPTVLGAQVHPRTDPDIIVRPANDVFPCLTTYL